MGSVAATVLMLSACQTTGDMFAGIQDSPQETMKAKAIAAMDVTVGSGEVAVLASEGLAALEAGDLAAASTAFNAALKLDITNARLQFLNGLTYHLIGLDGDTSKLSLAEQGYTRALKFKSNDVLTKRHLARLYMDQRKYAAAEGLMASVAVYHPDDPEVLYDLASAAYYNHDPKTAEAALNQLVKVDPAAAAKPDVVKALAMVKGAMNDIGGAEKDIARFATLDGVTEDQVMRLERRVSNWNDFYDYDVGVTKTQYDPYGGGVTGSPYGGSADPYGGNADPYGGSAGQPSTVGDPMAGGGGFAEDNMVVVDVVLIGTQEDVRSSRGMNLLNGLQLQFGDPLTGTPGFSYQVSNAQNRIDPTLSDNTRTLTKYISIPAVTYSLNIANDANSLNKVLAKPSLVAQSGATSEFFSGTEILAAAVSGGNGDSVSVQKEVGVKLSVTPEFLPDDKIRLHVVAERTFLTDPSTSVVFEFRMDTTKTTINSTVSMKYGETLILGGLSERENSNSADGVPGLMEVPGVNLLFSQSVKRQFERSILILLTPRRPQYARQNAKDREQTVGELSDLEKDLERLQRRHRDWFTPRPTFSQLIDNLQNEAFFDEFQIGDVPVANWYDPEGRKQRISDLKTQLAS